MRVLHSLLVVAVVANLTATGCRWSYELIEDGSQPMGDGDTGGSGSVSSGGTGASSSSGALTGGGGNGSGGTGGAGSGSGGDGVSGATSGASGMGGTAGTGTGTGGTAGTGTGTGGTAGTGTGGTAGTGTGTGGTAGTGGTGTGTGGTGTGTGGTGTGMGGTGTGGTAGTGTGTGGTAGVVGDYVVDTGVDEDNGPAAGAGLSLREAIILANATGGTQTITFEPDVDVVVVLGNLPNITEPLEIIGTGNLIDATNQGDNQPTFYSAAGAVVLRGIEVINSPSYPVLLQNGAGYRVENSIFRNCDSSVFLNGDNIVFAGNLVEGGQDVCVAIDGVNSEVRDNQVFDCAGYGLFLNRNSGGVVVTRNLLVRNQTGIAFSGLTGATLYNNTIVGSMGNGLLVGQASGLDLRNNIVVGSGSYGVNATNGNTKLLPFDHNLLFGNTNGPCNDCTIDGTFVTQDPLFINQAGNTEADFHLSLTPVLSPAVNAGTDVGLPANGAPDIGFWESN